jgi:hypothetical protein
MSTITHLARVPGKELPQEVPLKPIPVCPPPAVADLHDAHSHPGFTMRQHSAHVENPPVPCEAFVLQQIVHALRRSHHTKVAGIAMRIARRVVVQRDRTRAWAGQRRADRRHPADGRPDGLASKPFRCETRSAFGPPFDLTASGRSLFAELPSPHGQLARVWPSVLAELLESSADSRSG